MAFNQYVILSNTGALAGGKRLYVLFESYQDQITQKRKTQLTLNAKTFTSMGARGRDIAFKALIQHTPSDAAYFSKAQFEAYRDGLTIALNKFKFQDIYGTQMDVVFSDLPDLRPEMSPILEGADGWWSAEVKLVKLQ